MFGLLKLNIDKSTTKSKNIDILLPMLPTFMPATHIQRSY